MHRGVENPLLLLEEGVPKEVQKDRGTFRLNTPEAAWPKCRAKEAQWHSTGRSVAREGGVVLDCMWNVVDSQPFSLFRAGRSILRSWPRVTDICVKRHSRSAYPPHTSLSH